MGDIERMSPKRQAVGGVVKGGVILLAAAFLILFTDLWWLIFVFGWMVFPALGTFARGIANLVESGQEERMLQNSREQELLEALRDRGELTPAQAAGETSLTVKEADGMIEGARRGRTPGGTCARRGSVLLAESVGYRLTAHSNAQHQGERGAKMSDPNLDERAKAAADLLRLDPASVRSVFRLVRLLPEEGGRSTLGHDAEEV
jgi:hypothetical protein